MHRTTTLIRATQDQLFSTGKQQLAHHRIDAIVSGRNGHLLAKLEARWQETGLARQSGSTREGNPLSYSMAYFPSRGESGQVQSSAAASARWSASEPSR